jgi:hypothetical protein
VVPWLNWIEQPPPKGQVTGSNPVGVTKLKSLLFSVAEICFATLGFLGVASSSGQPIIFNDVFPSVPHILGWAVVTLTTVG